MTVTRFRYVAAGSCRASRVRCLRDIRDLLGHTMQDIHYGHSPLKLIDIFDASF